MEPIKLSEAYRNRAVMEYGLEYTRPTIVNPEAAILKVKFKQWESGNKFLSFSEFLLMDKEVIAWK